MCRYKKVLMAAICLYSSPTMQSLVVPERAGSMQCNMFILLVVNEASGPPSSAAANVAKQMYALRFNQIPASLGDTWF